MSQDKTSKRAPGAIEEATALKLDELVDYGEGAVVSRTLAKGPAGTLTIFAFDEGQELSEHSAPFDAYVTVLEGRARLTIGGQPVQVEVGEVVLMPAGVPHAVAGEGRFKMMLVMLKQSGVEA
jgi:quercetin dioxygenase-like cupin family protein